MPTVHIIDTRVANMASMRVALERLGQTVAYADSPASIREAEQLVLPGVGSFRAGMERLEQLEIRELLCQRIEQDRPTLAVCLGFQLLCQASEESPGVKGLGVLPVQVKRFPDTVAVPQLGWNRVSASENQESDEMLVWQDGDAYFANSFCVRSAPAGWSYATSQYPDRFVSAIWRGNILACQFHPELSGPWGQELLDQWLKQSYRCLREDSTKC